VTDNEYGVLLRHAYKFWCAAAGSSKSADQILHRETPLILKNRSEMQQAILKIKEVVGVP
jgi:hypothetical protein